MTDAYLEKERDPFLVCIIVEPVKMHDEELLLVSFLDGSVVSSKTHRLPALTRAGGPPAAELEHRLADVTRSWKLLSVISTAQGRSKSA